MPDTTYAEFTAIRGEETEDDSNWPWDNEHYITVRRGE